MSNDYNVEQYELLRAMGLSLIERCQNAELEIDPFLDALRTWILAPTSRKGEIRAIRKYGAHIHILEHYELLALRILQLCETGTTGFITQMIEDLKPITKESLDEF